MLKDKDISRFWKKVDKRSDHECWNWTAYKDKLGYGFMEVSGKKQASYRIAYMIAYGEIQNGLCVCHKCDNPSCCNPKHLFAGTQLDNIKDRNTKGRTSKGEKHSKIMFRVSARGERNGSYTHPERVARGIRNGRYTHPEKTARGEQNGRAKITESDVLRIRELRENGNTLKKIAQKFGIGISQTFEIVKHKAWTK